MGRIESVLGVIVLVVGMVFLVLAGAAIGVGLMMKEGSRYPTPSPDDPPSRKFEHD